MRMRLKEIATKKELYLNKIHLETGIDIGVLRRYWSDDTRSYERNISQKLKNYLGVTYGELFADDDETTVHPAN